MLFATRIAHHARFSFLLKKVSREFDRKNTLTSEYEDLTIGDGEEEEEWKLSQVSSKFSCSPHSVRFHKAQVLDYFMGISNPTHGMIIYS